MIGSLAQLEFLFQNLFLLSHWLCCRLWLALCTLSIIEEKGAAEVALTFSTNLLSHDRSIQTFMVVTKFIVIHILIDIDNFGLQTQIERCLISDCLVLVVSKWGHLRRTLTRALFKTTGHAELGSANHRSIAELRVGPNEVVLRLQLDLCLFSGKSYFLVTVHGLQICRSHPMTRCQWSSRPIHKVLLEHGLVSLLALGEASIWICTCAALKAVRATWCGPRRLSRAHVRWHYLLLIKPLLGIDMPHCSLWEARDLVLFALILHSRIA